ncbi:hypothetical protein [Plantactinospora sp. KLBMP9567]|uniref:hypothetical protein n=1 Tax=Plantactinospora sp. KLBMP9567 TaxID=3085900 RepID=UPI002981AC1F|nr:hypothetical protein [Plantactinospora sp. KLBMP9567]MDW5323775.1 hypothetical protein [Plantactinospora sp. KLBMP9567]MDW5326895.1 hypothetical protein [Plantactinospora sp. KLBMP9567]
MGSLPRSGIVGAAFTLALLTGGCGTVPKEPPVALRVGYDTLDGTLQVWPSRGALAGDPQATAAVARAVDEWRSPVEDRVHLPSSGILWLGEVDGGRLALVAADVPGEAGSWLLQLTGDGADFTVDRAVEYTDPGYLVYSDVLPVQLPTGRRYLVSARVDRLLGPDRRPLAVTDGLTGPVALPACAARTVTARLRPSESLPSGKAADRLIDLGTGIEGPRYPLVGDDTGSGAKVLDGLDTCALGTRTGPFGSIPHRVHGEAHPGSVPVSWPIDRLSTKELAEVELVGAGEEPAKLEQLSWRTDEGMMTAALFRPAGGPPLVSAADRLEPLQAYVLPLSSPVVVLVWQPSPETSLALPANTTRLVDRPGLVVVPKPATRETFSLIASDKTTDRSAGGN